MREDLLFNATRIRDVIENHMQSALKMAGDVVKRDFEERSHDEICEEICQKYALIVPTLREDEISVSQREIDIPIRSRRDYGWMDDNSQSMRGIAVDVKIPFDGDGDFFKIKPNAYDLNPPRGQLRSGTLVITISVRNLTNDEVKAEIVRNVTLLNKYLTWHRQALSGFDDSLQSSVSEAVNRRNESLKANAKLISNLGYKIDH